MAENFIRGKWNVGHEMGEEFPENLVSALWSEDDADHALTLEQWFAGVSSATDVAQAVGQALVMQIGPEVQTLPLLPDPWRTVFAALAVLALDGPEVHAALITEINSAVLTDDTARLTKIGIAVSSDEQIAEFVTQAMSGHRYVGPALISLLEQVKQRYFFAMSNYLWVKRANRSLWYTMVSHGMPNPYAEAIGSYALHRLEVNAGEPLSDQDAEEVIAKLAVRVMEVASPALPPEQTNVREKVRSRSWDLSHFDVPAVEQAASVSGNDRRFDFGNE